MSDFDTKIEKVVKVVIYGFFVYVLYDLIFMDHDINENFRVLKVGLGVVFYQFYLLDKKISEVNEQLYSMRNTWQIENNGNELS